MNTIQKFDTIHQYNEFLGQETLHPLHLQVRRLYIRWLMSSIWPNHAVSGTVSILSVFTRYF